MSFILVKDPVSTVHAAAASVKAELQMQAHATQQSRAMGGSAEPQPKSFSAIAAVLPVGRNRRWSQRSGVRMTGCVSAGPSETAESCVVVDLSKHGAMLEVNDDAELPECFVLVFHNRRTRCEANCVVRWRRDGRVGVCFAGPVRSIISRQ
jgi:PilZ domain